MGLFAIARRRRSWRQGRRRVVGPAWMPLAAAVVLMAGLWVMDAAQRGGLDVPRQDGDLARPVGAAAAVATLPACGSGRATCIIDGDTVRHRGRTMRLVGFDTPETGRQARCATEDALGRRATARLVQLAAGARDIALQPVRCACRAGTHGTRACNYGRDCGTLRLDGRDAGQILIAEGLARSYVCGATRCPPRKPWC